MMLESLLQHRQRRDGTSYLQPHCRQPARVFINSEQFQEDPMTSGQPMGHGRKGMEAPPVLWGHEPSWW